MLNRSKYSKSKLLEVFTDENILLKFDGDKKKKLKEIIIYKHGTNLYVIQDTKTCYFVSENRASPMEIVSHILQQRFEKTIKNKELQEKKKLKKEEIYKNMKIGDVFCTSWGYTMTFVEFFQVTRIISKSTVAIRPIFYNQEETGYLSGYKIPLKDEFIGDEKICRINEYGLSKVDRYDHSATKTDYVSKHYYSSCD